MISEEDIEHIAHLARIKITEKDKQKLVGEFESILKYIGKLNEVETADVEPTAQVTGLENVFRNDEPNDSESRERAALQNPIKILEQAPERHDDFIKVKSILKHK